MGELKENRKMPIGREKRKKGRKIKRTLPGLKLSLYHLEQSKVTTMPLVPNHPSWNNIGKVLTYVRRIGELRTRISLQLTNEGILA